MDSEAKIEVKQSTSAQLKAWSNKIIYHPLFGISIGVIISVITWYVSIQKPELTYYISPTRTAILQKGSLTNLSVGYQGIPIEGDLSSAEIVIWNHGKQAIHGGDRAHNGDILESITLRTTNRIRFYETSITPSRTAIGIDPVSTIENLASGIVPINFTILEHYDRIKVQIIYGGDVNVPFVLDGSIEGQPQGFAQYGVSIRQRRLKQFAVCFSAIVLVALLVRLVTKALGKVTHTRDLTPTQRVSKTILIMVIYVITSGLIGAGVVAFSNWFIDSKLPFTL